MNNPRRECQYRFQATASLLLIFWWATSVHAQTPVGTAFTYQGQLKDAGVPANGTYDLQFKLWDAATAGGQVGTTNTLVNTPVASGLFTVSLDFGAQFTGSRRWLEIGVRPGGSGARGERRLYRRYLAGQRCRQPAPLAAGTDP